MAEFILSGFGDEIAPALDTQLAVMGRLGIRHIELRGIDGRNISEFTAQEAPALAARLGARGFRASALGTPIGKIGIDEPFEEHLEMARRMIDVAEAIGCPYIRIFSFFLPVGEDPARHRAEVLRRLEAIAKAAQGRGPRLLHENERHIYGDTPERVVDLLDALGGAVGFTYDPSNFVQCDVDNKQAFPMLRKYVEYLHIKDSVYSEHKHQTLDHGFENVSDTHRPAGEGDSNVLWILSELSRMDYRGFLSIEPHLTNYAGVPGSGEDKFVVAYEAVHGLLEQLP